ncbi:carboxypeptidase-like regulatory domain-containing protein [Robertkochia solimangrovi]|uniref:carboxypeptidase-like regulatory domain-containing protein n=1 Tax=Robertkochia solimangrovi TaxID=2213046 RepID=UPI0013A54666|nr:carboxypeptidase-like regulatory domain-containing protein [Robertkochia solimangrovi]
MRLILVMCNLYCISSLSQENSLEGKVLDEFSKEPISGVTVRLKEKAVITTTDADGYFEFKTLLPGHYTLLLSAEHYITRSFPIVILQNRVLGEIFLEPIKSYEQDDIIVLPDGIESNNYENTGQNYIVLNSNTPVFRRKAAFDFGQAFYRSRGFDTGYRDVSLNGIKLNDPISGSAIWSNWGGLNDVLRDQEVEGGHALNSDLFGSLAGSVNMRVIPSSLRKGLRLSVSVSNRSYSKRMMATYSSGIKNKKFAWSMSGSVRKGETGYMNGTPYNALAIFAGLEYRFSDFSKLVVLGWYTPVRRAGNAAVTEEVHSLGGERYNPYWGSVQSEIRNTRVKKYERPLFQFVYTTKRKQWNLQFGFQYRFGPNSSSRLGYYNAPNPYPDYYRYLPSYYINHGGNFENARLAALGFNENSQVNWENLFAANQSFSQKGAAAYLLYDDVAKEQSISGKIRVAFEPFAESRIVVAAKERNTSSHNFARITDLLGASGHLDQDSFSNTSNDVNGKLWKVEGDLFNYNYLLKLTDFTGVGKFELNKSNWHNYFALEYSGAVVHREGRFLNERYSASSFGKSKSVISSGLSLKAGTAYAITGRHRLKLDAAYLQIIPTPDLIFINPREHDRTVGNLRNEKIQAVSLDYQLDYPDLRMLFSMYYYRALSGTDINFFYFEGGLGSDFVQEIVTGIDRGYKGMELGVEYSLTSELKVNGVVAWGDYKYLNDPDIAISFDTADENEDQINTTGYANLGKAKIKGYHLNTGPQIALSAGIEFRAQQYWWFGLSMNYLGQNYPGISTISRTESFSVDPETGEDFSEATVENIGLLLREEKLDPIYLLNFIGGKSWRIDNTYVSLFLSVNNLFDHSYRSGGYEQNRKANFKALYEDRLSGNPSFGPKYWYGSGRTYFLNLAINF